MSKKSEKRLAQKQLKLEKSLKKTARQFAEPAPLKHVTLAPSDVSKSLAVPNLNTAKQFMCWTRNHEDKEGNWTWGQPRDCGTEWGNIIHPFFLQYEKKTWGEIDSERTGKHRKRRAKHCFYSFNQIIEEAQERLMKLKIDDFSDHIFRFRLTGKCRVYGFRLAAIFHFLWYDPNHKIYPLDH